MRKADKVGMALAAGVLAADQISKLLVETGMAVHQSIAVIPGLVNLTHVRNTGAAFGLFAASVPGVRTALLLVAALVAVGVVACLWIRERQAHALHISSLSLILSGAVGNMIDRVRLGEVVDFVDLHWKGLHWPAFNVADSAITVGVALLLLQVLRPAGGRPSR
jgi:signal peptidase II